MADVRMMIPKPTIPSEAVLSDPRNTIKAQSRTGELLVTFDEKRNAGAVYSLEARVWRIYCPVNLHELLTALHHNGITLPDGPDLQTWLDQVSGANDDPERH